MAVVMLASNGTVEYDSYDRQIASVVFDGQDLGIIQIAEGCSRARRCNPASVWAVMTAWSFRR